MRISDWSSYVCSSDLRWLKMSLRIAYRSRRRSVLSALKLESCKRWNQSASSTYATSHCSHRRRRQCQSHATRHGGTANPPTASRAALRITSEERRVGQVWVRPCTSRWYHENKK